MLVTSVSGAVGGVKLCCVECSFNKSYITMKPFQYSLFFDHAEYTQLSVS